MLRAKSARGSPGTDAVALADRVSGLERRVEESERAIRDLRERHGEKRPASIKEQTESNRLKMCKAMGIDPDYEVDIKEIRGMLSDCVDPDENSQELVRRVRDS